MSHVSNTDGGYDDLAQRLDALDSLVGVAPALGASVGSTEGEQTLSRMIAGTSPLTSRISVATFRPKSRLNCPPFLQHSHDCLQWPQPSSLLCARAAAVRC